MCIYYYDSFLLLKKGFLFSVNACVYIPMMFFLLLKFFEGGKNRYTGEWLIFFCLGF